MSACAKQKHALVLVAETDQPWKWLLYKSFRTLMHCKHGRA